ncbi:MAG TPA: hypothetical protein VHB21_10565 [Minicystis sp.]|nr:hypothetical protein [Minicystis sp.]
MAHWIDKAEIPETAKAHFRRYHDIRSAWERCPNGVYLIWLVNHFGGAAERADAARIASVAVRQLRNALDAHFASMKTADRSDALTLAYRDVIGEVASATGSGEGPTSSRRGPPSAASGNAGYDGYRSDALTVIADAIRNGMHPPEE